MLSKVSIFLSYLLLMFLLTFSKSEIRPIYQEQPYPPLETSQYDPNLYTSFVYLPIILLGDTAPSPPRYYAQAEKIGEFFGVWAVIETPNPVIREPYFSYSSINIISSNGLWIEAGINKGVFTSCVPKFSWAIQPGDPHIILDPLPQVGIPYQFKIEKLSDGDWRIRILNMSNLVLYQAEVDNPGFISGARVQAVGEVNSPQKLNDMGVSGILSLRWKMSGSTWSNWNGWTLGVMDYPPYLVQGVLPDQTNNVQISGNNGNPIPPGAPCP